MLLALSFPLVTASIAFTLLGPVIAQLSCVSESGSLYVNGPDGPTQTVAAGNICVDGSLAFATSFVTADTLASAASDITTPALAASSITTISSAPAITNDPLTSVASSAQTSGVTVNQFNVYEGQTGNTAATSVTSPTTSPSSDAGTTPVTTGATSSCSAIAAPSDGAKLRHVAYYQGLSLYRLWLVLKMLC